MNIELARLLTSLGKLNPAAWDAIIPHGPIQAQSPRAVRTEQVELNPQPLPPKGAELEFAAIEVANQIAAAAIAAEAAGGEVEALVSRAIDDWCGTPPRPHHHRIPWPGPWPFPWNVLPGEELDAEAAQVAGALTLASIASRISEDSKARNALGAGAERLLQASMGE